MNGVSALPIPVAQEAYPINQDAALRKMLSAEMRHAPQSSTLCDVVCKMWAYQPSAPMPVTAPPAETAAYPRTPNGSPNSIYMPHHLLAPGIPLEPSELLLKRRAAAAGAGVDVPAGPATPPTIPGFWEGDTPATTATADAPQMSELDMARELIGMGNDVPAGPSAGPADFDWFFGGGAPAPLPLPEIEREIEKHFPSAESSPTRVTSDPDYDPREGRRSRRATRGGWESSEDNSSWASPAVVAMEAGAGATGGRSGGKRRRGVSSVSSSDAEGDWAMGTTSPRARESKAARVRNQRKCACCGATSTPQWRHGPEGTTVCNACGVASHKQKKAQAQAERAAEKAAAAEAAAKAAAAAAAASE